MERWIPLALLLGCGGLAALAACGDADGPDFGGGGTGSPVGGTHTDGGSSDGGSDGGGSDGGSDGGGSDGGGSDGGGSGDGGGSADCESPAPCIDSVSGEFTYDELLAADVVKITIAYTDAEDDLEYGTVHVTGDVVLDIPIGTGQPAWFEGDDVVFEVSGIDTSASYSYGVQLADVVGHTSQVVTIDIE
jgi:hypothetical protein